MASTCRSGLHDLGLPDAILVEPATGKRRCRLCRHAQAARNQQKESYRVAHRRANENYRNTIPGIVNRADAKVREQSAAHASKMSDLLND